MRRLTILGSTGSIGINTLRVVDNLPGEFQLVGLSGHRNSELLVRQALHYQPEFVVVTDPEVAGAVERELGGSGIEILIGRPALLDASARSDVDLVLNALVGSAGMEPTITALRAGVNVALSNKESLVMAGGIIEKIKAESGAALYPVDSEHSAIWQCLTGENMADVKRLVLTGSGGPFRTLPLADFPAITREQALSHPNWSMGNKITVDSATMMNKGLEVIEARWLFDLPADKIDIVIHPQSIIHSLVEFHDGSQKAQLGLPDMKIPIQFALTYPRHRTADWESLDLAAIGQLTFEEADTEKFPCIALAYEALRKGGTAPVALNVANEEAVYGFLEGNIGFTRIPELIAAALEKSDWVAEPDLTAILETETQVRKFMRELS